MIKAKEQFSDYLKRRYGDRSTPKHYISDLNVFIRTIGQKKPTEVTSQDVDAFIDQQLDLGLKASTINRRLNAVRSLFEYLASVAGDEAGANPVNWRRHRLPEGNYLARDATDETVQKLFAVMQKKRDRAMFGLMVGAGLRVGEVAELKCSDLSQPAQVGESARLQLIGKGRKERVVWVTPRWYQEIVGWLEERETTSCKHLFLNQHGRALSVSGIQYCLKQYAHKAQISLSCHQLRHTFARRLATQKMPTESIAVLLGHAKVSTTQRYTAGANPELKDSFLQAMNDIEAQEQVDAERLLSGSGAPRREKRDPALLAAALTSLEALPEWLQPTVKSYFRRRWRNWKPHTAPKLTAQLENNLLRHWQTLLTTYELTGWASLQRSHLEDWLNSRLEAGLTAKSVQSDFSLIKGCLLEAVELGHNLSANLFRIRLPKLPTPMPRFLSPANFQRLQQTVQQETEVDSFAAALDRAWFLTLCQTGVRSSELLDMRLGDLDFAQQRLFVNSGKNGDERIVYLTPTLIAALARYLTYRPNSTDDHLWLLANGRLLQARQIGYRLKKWGKVAAVAVSPHRLRHTFATQLVNQGMPLASVAKLLGHRKLDMTQHYARLYEGTVKEQFETAIAHIEGILAVDWPQAPLFEPIESQFSLFT